MDAVLTFLDQGLLDLSGWQIVLVTLALTHVTIAGVTIFLHRCQAHRALDLHPISSHFFRLWLWLTTGMVTKEWAAVHRKHHAKCEREGDPHSPVVFGLRKVLLQGAELYRIEAANQETVEKYGHGTPNDWLERNVYSRYSAYGIVVMLLLDVLLFGFAGLAVWGVQMLWSPVTAAGIINGLGHAKGYRNFDIADTSTNLIPWGIIIGGEELHNNHHAYATSAKLSSRWFEFDIGWMYIRIMSALGLAKVRKVAPKPRLLGPAAAKSAADSETLQAVIALRYELMADFARALRNACTEEAARLKSLKSPEFKLLDAARGWIPRDSAKWSGEQQAKLKQVFAASSRLKFLVEMRQELASLWERSHHSTEHLVGRLQDWCERAEASGVAALRDMAQNMRRFAPVS
ncbi:MAG: fatty acid desaturase [Burkholderiaceae bacterium]